MWVDRVPPGCPYINYLEETNTTNPAPTLLTSLYSKTPHVHRDWESFRRFDYQNKGVSQRFPTSLYVAQDSSQLHQSPDQTQPLVLQSQQLAGVHVDPSIPVSHLKHHSGRFDVFKSTNHNDQSVPLNLLPRNNLRHVSGVPQDHRVTPTPNVKNHVSARDKRLWNPLQHPSSRFSTNPSLTLNALDTQVNIQRQYRCLALEILKFWVHRHRNTLKVCFVALLRHQRPAFYKVNPSGTIHSTMHEYVHTQQAFHVRQHYKTMALIFLQHLLQIIRVRVTLCEKQQCFLRFQSLCFRYFVCHKNTSPIPHRLSHFESFQLERGIRCVECVILPIVFRHVRSTLEASTPQWKDIRFVIQRVIDAAQHHLKLSDQDSRQEGVTPTRDETGALPWPYTSQYRILDPSLTLHREPCTTHSQEHDVLQESLPQDYSFVDRVLVSDAPKVTCAESLMYYNTHLLPKGGTACAMERDRTMEIIETRPLPNSNVINNEDTHPRFIDKRDGGNPPSYRDNHVGNDPVLKAVLRSKSSVTHVNADSPEFHKETRLTTNDDHAPSNALCCSPPQPSMKTTCVSKTIVLNLKSTDDDASDLPSTSCGAKTPHFLNSFRLSPVEGNELVLCTESSWSAYNILHRLTQGSFMVKFNRKNGKASWRYVWVDLHQGLLRWGASKPGAIVLPSDVFVKDTAPEAYPVQRKSSQAFSRYLLPFHRTKGTETRTLAAHQEKSFYKPMDPPLHFNSVKRSQSTLASSLIRESKSSFIGSNPSQSISLSEIYKITYTWIHSPHPAVPLFRKHVTLTMADTLHPTTKVHTKEMITQSAQAPKTVYCLTFLICVRSEPTRSRSFINAAKLPGVFFFSKSPSVTPTVVYDFLQFTCFDHTQLYTWLLGLHLLAASYKAVYPSPHFSRHLQAALCCAPWDFSIHDQQQGILKRMLARLRWIKARRHIWSLSHREARIH